MYLEPPYTPPGDVQGNLESVKGSYGRLIWPYRPPWGDQGTVETLVALPFLAYEASY